MLQLYLLQVNSDFHIIDINFELIARALNKFNISINPLKQLKATT